MEAARERADPSSDLLTSQQYRSSPLFPATPRKIVCEDHSLIDIFRSSASFQKIICYLQACSESIFSTPFSLKQRNAIVHRLRDAAAHSGHCAAWREAEFSPASGVLPPTGLTVDGERHFAPVVVCFLTELFPVLNKIVDDVPLEDMAQQRFGNRAKRVFHEKMEAVIEDWTLRLVQALPEHTGESIAPYSYDPATNTYALTPTTAQAKRSEVQRKALATELAAYVRDSFGNATRLDYGTGHELHFFLVMMICLEEMGDVGGTLLTDPEERARNVFVPHVVERPAPVPVAYVERTRDLRRQMVFYVFQEYLNFCRRLQRHYSLEPAGSHGVWGLDDYHHIPYIFGAAQLIYMEEPPSAPVAAPPPPGGTNTTNAASASTEHALTSPGEHGVRGAGHGVVLTAYVTEKNRVKELADDFMYFGMVEWILQNKNGPFFEHSNMLYNISAVARWFKTYAGMVKMYGAEVLSKFNVVQHLLFGVHLPWNTHAVGERPMLVSPALPSSLV